MNKRRKMLFIIFVFFLVSSTLILMYTSYSNFNSEDTYKVLRKDNDKIENIENPINFEKAWKVNKDIIAWIKIPNTSVDYPILQHPNEDNYYLNRNVNKVKARLPGSIYINLNNKSDFSSNNTIIYGHNIKFSKNSNNNIMFSDLMKYYNKDFFDNNKEVFIYTPDKILKYEIFAAITYHNKLISAVYNLDQNEGYKKFISSIYNTDIKKNNYSKRKVTTKDKIITLSTCTIDHNSDYRYLIVAALVD